MTLEDLVSKYINGTEHVFAQLEVIQASTPADKERINGIVEHAKRYLEDAKYYERKNRLETSLASVAYCEGLLDALLLLGVVEFSW